MANTRLAKTLSELTTFTRATAADYEAIDGTTQTAAIDEPRFEYLGGTAEVDGEPQGLKFGDGDLLVAPLGGWFNPLEGIGLIRTKSVLGDVVLSAGAGVSLQGPDGWKTQAFRWTEGSSGVPAGPLEFFPAAPNDGVTRYCAGFAGYVLDLVLDDLALMEEFNEILNGEGF